MYVNKIHIEPLKMTGNLREMEKSPNDYIFVYYNNVGYILSNIKDHLSTTITDIVKF